MGTTASKRRLEELTPEQLGLEATVMALREELMSYFKGSCIGRVTESSSIVRVNLMDYVGRGRYAYQRQQMEHERPTLVLLGGAPVFTMRENPSRMEFHTGVLHRSPQLREVYKQIDKFMDKYLQGVRKGENNATVIYG